MGSIISFLRSCIETRDGTVVNVNCACFKSSVNDALKKDKEVSFVIELEKDDEILQPG